MASQSDPLPALQYVTNYSDLPAGQNSSQLNYLQQPLVAPRFAPAPVIAAPGTAPGSSPLQQRNVVDLPPPHNQGKL